MESLFFSEKTPSSQKQCTLPIQNRTKIMMSKVTEIVDNPMAANKEVDPYWDTVLNKKQIPVPWVKKTHLVAPWFLKADGKIAKYDMPGLHIWRVRYTHS